jgi:hypothetical protein
MHITDLHLIVACADRKSVAAGPPVRLGAVKAGPVSERCSRWWNLLAFAPARTPARDLYVGGHWSVAKELPALARARGFAARLWVCSAGYGLVPAETPLASYSATFAADMDDSVAPKGADWRPVARTWWTELSKRRLPQQNSPRTLDALADSAAPGSVFLVVASRAYIVAMERDIGAIVEGRRRIRLVLVTSGSESVADRFRDYTVPATAALRMSLGGALNSLHARVARRLLETLSPAKMDAATARRHVEQLAARGPKLPAIKRAAADDDDIRRFIRKALLRDAPQAHTRLLREYRAAGHACEQGRFRDLFMAEKGGS